MESIHGEPADEYSISQEVHKRFKWLAESILRSSSWQLLPKIAVSNILARRMLRTTIFTDNDQIRQHSTGSIRDETPGGYALLRLARGRLGVHLQSQLCTTIGRNREILGFSAVKATTPQAVWLAWVVQEVGQGFQSLRA